VRAWPQLVLYSFVLRAAKIGSRAWVNARAIVLPGITIGEGAVVAAGAVVTKDVELWGPVAGVPARVVGERPQGLEYRLFAREHKVWGW